MPPSPTGLVRRAETRLVDARGAELLAHGVNSYPLLDHAGRGDLESVRDVFSRAKSLNRPIVRTLAFNDAPEHPGRLRDADGSLREEGLCALDQVIALAEEQGVRLILVLGNHWDDYGGANAVLKMIAPDEPLAREAFYVDPRAVGAQASFVRAIVSRVSSVTERTHASSEAVLAWELLNEARCENDDLCDESTLGTWARDMSFAIRAAGATQLIAWGGSGHFDSHGEYMADIAMRGGVDVLTLHVYPQLSDDALRGMPNQVPRGLALGCDVIARTAELAHSLGMPLLVEEAGWRGTDEDRALALSTWSACAVNAGVAMLPWMIGEAGRMNYDGFLIDLDGDTVSKDALTCVEPPPQAP